MVTKIVDVHVDGNLIVRVRGEYNEMPGLKLTLAQACRLWNTDQNTSAHVLNALVARAFLRRVGAAYVRADCAA